MKNEDNQEYSKGGVVLNGVHYHVYDLNHIDHVLAGKQGILGDNYTLISWSVIKKLLKKYCN